MKTIKIFLASSIEDLRIDRLEVGDFIGWLNNIYAERDIRFHLVKCEQYDNSVAIGGKQQEYDREIRESDLVFFLFFRKVGEYTKHELEVALEAFRSENRPRIVTYFKYVDDAEEMVQEVRDFMQLLDQELKHYYNRYNHIDTLKLGIIMQIKLLKLDNVQLKLKDGFVFLDGSPVVKAENVPMLRENKPLRELFEKQRQLQSDLPQYREAFLKNATEETEAAFIEARKVLDQVSKQLEEVQRETMELLSTVAEMTADGRILTYRQKEALKYFEKGDYTAVQAILDDKEREKELERAKKQLENAKNGIQGNVNEELLLIKTKRAQGLTKAGVEEIIGRYKKIEALVEEYRLDPSALFEYAAFLWLQNLPAQGIEVAKKLLGHYAEDADKAGVYNLLGALYQKRKAYAKAKEAYQNALNIYLRQAPGTYEAETAACYNNLGTLYGAPEHQKAADAYDEALKICKRLAQQDPKTHETALAECYNNIGTLHHELLRNGKPEDAFCNAEKAKDAYKKALEIDVRLAERDPKTCQPALAASYYNQGQLFKDIALLEDAREAYEEAEQAFCEAESAFNEALKRYLCLAEENPGAYEPSLAECYSGIGSLHDRCWRYGEREEAFKAYETALDIRQHLAAADPELYAAKWNTLLWYYETEYAKCNGGAHCLPVLRKALPLYEKLAAKKPEIYGEGLAFIRQSLSEE